MVDPCAWRRAHKRKAISIDWSAGSSSLTSERPLVMIRKSVSVVLTVVAFSSGTYAPVAAQSPQEMLNGLIQQQMQEQDQSHRNEMMRLELERQELQQRLQERERYKQLSDQKVMAELSRYCPSGEPPCQASPPQTLLEEAGRRRLIVLDRFLSTRSSRQPTMECVTIGDDEGGGITDCH